MRIQDLKLVKRSGGKPAAGVKIFLTPTLSYVSFSAFSEVETGFVLRGFIALNNPQIARLYLDECINFTNDD